MNQQFVSGMEGPNAGNNDEPQFSLLSSGGQVDCHRCTQAGAIHVADIRQIQDDPLRFRDEPDTVVSMSSFGRKCPRHDAIQSTLNVYGSKAGFDLGPYPKSVSFYLFLSNLQSAGAGKSLEETLSSL